VPAGVHRPAEPCVNGFDRYCRANHGAIYAYSFILTDPAAAGRLSAARLGSVLRKAGGNAASRIVLLAPEGLTGPQLRPRKSRLRAEPPGLPRGPGGEPTERTEPQMVRAKPLPFSPEPARSAVIQLTRASIVGGGPPQWP
jgi:hypothetical protein